MTATWAVHLASATGSRHLDAGLPCQDAAASRTWDGGFVAAVSDGAGSAPCSEEGSRHLVDRLAELIAIHPFATAAPWAEWLPALVAQARDELLELARSRGHEARDYACTLVGCVVHEGQGSFFHVGDGSGVHRGAGRPTVVSPPENGEYADETYFVTQEDWRDHLRLTGIDAVDASSLIGLMSDGAMPFVLDRGRGDFFPPFIDPVRRHLAGRPPAEGGVALLGVLQDPRTFDITGDDKTLVLAMPA